MSRSMTTALRDGLQEKAIAPVIFCELEFSGGIIRLWSGVGTITWNGNSWVGGGRLIAIGDIAETKRLEANPFNLSLSGVPSELVAVAYGDFSQGRPIRVYLGLLNVSAGIIIADPVQIFAGRMDTIGDDDDGSTSRITVSAESNLADLNRIRARYFTHQDQLRLLGNRSLRYVASLQDRPIYWGTARHGQNFGETTV